MAELVPGARLSAGDGVDPDFFGYRDLLDDDDRKLLAGLREWLETNLAPIVDDYWSRAEFPSQLVASLAELDVMGLSLDLPDRPARSRLLGGFVGLEFARIDASFASFYGVHSGLAMGTIAQCGSDEQRERWLPAMRRLELIGAFGLTEPHGGSDVAGGLETTARRDGDDWVIDGAKRWIGNGTFADLVMVWARDVADDEVKCFVVEKGMPGFTAAKMEGKVALRITQNADLTFDGVRVPEANRLQNANSFHDTNSVLRATRGSVAWSAVGVQTGVFEVAAQYARDREQFGRPIGGFQLIQAHLAGILGNLTASLGMAVRGAQLQDDGVFEDAQGALAKSFCTTRLRESVAWARELMGGNGIVLEYGMARYFNDAEALYSYEGTREINSLIVGRAITGESAFT
ncbi:acyl-CoA dehydrogenase family protein [Jatrophihabitans endophyticus]|uniref:acyl-CoA dehydrogenase family protein n=1 Tax=Jatrophihabitans endophyticus TaxID=1206085 RepID=UPI0019DE5D38|nr:acyl-CoA dehydrogenase family protein [Jatrophihabitans endophyticus]MBE7190166.1 acyl-CoA dehydrogenase family protein [Jatrophihabitans endophyticus]